MVRKIVIAGLGSILLACMPAYAQEMPELDGAPPPLKIPKTSTPQPKAVTPAPKPRATLPAVSSAKQAEALKVEQARLDKQAAELKARQASLDARAAELAAREKQLAEQTAAQQEALAAQRADLKRQRDELSRQMAEASARDAQVAEREDNKTVTPPRKSGGVSLASARRSCALAAEDEARERNFYSAEYDEAPYFFQTRTLQLRGAMRLEDRRGYVIVNTVCELDRDGEALNIAFVR